MGPHHTYDTKELGLPISKVGQCLPDGRLFIFGLRGPMVTPQSEGLAFYGENPYKEEAWTEFTPRYGLIWSSIMCDGMVGV